jgi:hypothetical protein
MSSSGRVFVEPQRLREVWEFVRPGLLEVKRASRDQWIPEDIYVDCFEGRSMLWLMVEDGNPVGFGVLQPMGDTLHIWAGWGKFLMEDGFRHAHEIALAGGARKISFDSSRPGWAKIAGKYGFKPVKWIAEVKNGFQKQTGSNRN